MSPRDTLLAVARILQSRDIPAQVAFIRSRTPTLMVRGDIAARVNESGSVVIWGVMDNGGAVILRAHTCRGETAEDIARLVEVRQLLADAVAMGQAA